MRLSAVLDVHLHLRMAGVDPGEEAIEVRLAVSRQEREDAARLAEELLDDGRSDVVEFGAARDRPVADQAEEVALTDGDTVQLRVA